MIFPTISTLGKVGHVIWNHLAMVMQTPKVTDLVWKSNEQLTLLQLMPQITSYKLLSKVDEMLA